MKKRENKTIQAIKGGSKYDRKKVKTCNNGTGYFV